MIKILLALTRIPGIGENFIKKNIYVFSEGTSSKVIEKLNTISNKISKASVEEFLPWADSVLSRCKELNIQILPIFDELYPYRLKELSNPPAVLYFLGNVSLLKEKIISIIGTRHSTNLGNTIANKVGAYFSQKYTICNGLVEGIDKNVVIKGDSVYNNIIGVLSGGLNFEHTSSKTTIDLAQKVLNKEGLLISEYEPDKKEDQFSGSKSSRIQAGISDALLLIQSSTNGGSKYTIKASSKLNRIIAYIAFEKNREFNLDDSFSANRLFLSKGLGGIVQICEIKKLKTISISKLIPIRSLSDYSIVENAIEENAVSQELFEKRNKN